MSKRLEALLSGAPIRSSDLSWQLGFVLLAALLVVPLGSSTAFGQQMHAVADNAPNELTNEEATQKSEVIVITNADLPTELKGVSVVGTLLIDGKPSSQRSLPTLPERATVETVNRQLSPHGRATRETGSRNAVQRPSGYWPSAVVIDRGARSTRDLLRRVCPYGLCKPRVVVHPKPKRPEARSPHNVDALDSGPGTIGYVARPSRHLGPAAPLPEKTRGRTVKRYRSNRSD